MMGRMKFEKPLPYNVFKMADISYVYFVRIKAKISELLTLRLYEFVNKQQKFYSLPKRYQQIRHFEQRPFVEN